MGIRRWIADKIVTTAHRNPEPPPGPDAEAAPGGAGSRNRHGDRGQPGRCPARRCRPRGVVSVPGRAGACERSRGPMVPGLP